MLESIQHEYENLNPLMFDISLNLDKILTFVGPTVTRLSVFFFDLERLNDSQNISERVTELTRILLRDGSTERTKTSLPCKHLYGHKTEPRSSTCLFPCQGQAICRKSKEIKATGGKGNIRCQFSTLFRRRY